MKIKLRIVKRKLKIRKKDKYLFIWWNIINWFIYIIFINNAITISEPWWFVLYVYSITLRPRTKKCKFSLNLIFVSDFIVIFIIRNIFMNWRHFNILVDNFFMLLSLTIIDFHRCGNVNLCFRKIMIRYASNNY